MSVIYTAQETCEIVASDGNWTIGYVDGSPAQWDGNTRQLEIGDHYYPSHEDSSEFNCGDGSIYTVVDGEWQEVD